MSAIRTLKRIRSKYYINSLNLVNLKFYFLVILIDCSHLQLDVYSATLYDALLTYAMAAKKIKDDYYLENGSQELAVREANVKTLIKNGTRMAKVSSIHRHFIVPTIITGAAVCGGAGGRHSCFDT